MSWIEQIDNDLIITTGEGTRFTPSWLNASFSVEYNVAQFEFPGLRGSLVKRGTPIGRKYNLELYFEGENHLETSSRFEIAARDNRPWTLEHPFYGLLIVQPASLNFDNTGYNVSKITGVVTETITEDNPKSIPDPVDAIKLNKELLDETFITTFTEQPTAIDINTMAANNQKNYTQGVKIIELPEEAEAYFNAFNAAKTAINTATASPLLAMRAAMTLITYPALFTADVKNRVNQLVGQFNTLHDSLANIFEVSSKQIFQNHAGTNISAMCLAAATPLDGNYTNNKSVFEIIELILNSYETYLSDLDVLQTPTGFELNSFIPDADSITALNSLVNLTVSNLYNIALGARSERSIITEYDTNIIILTHRFYGLDPEDRNIDELIENNNIGLNRLLQIKKGTKIVYYI